VTATNSLPSAVKKRPEPMPSAAAALDRNRNDDLAVPLVRARARLDSVLSGSARYSRALAGLHQRLVEGRLQVAVLGQFKRGKSSFLNALLGAPVLATGVVPITAIATFIRWAAAPAVRVSYLDGRPDGELGAADTDRLREQLARFVTEEENPRNRRGVARVELLCPAPVLQHGIVLIDTPGVGSTLQHNSDAALEVLPECDAGFFVLSADPPVTEAEIAYLERVRPHLARLFFVFNKIDYLAAEERGVALAFLRRSLRDHMPAIADAPIFTLSARQALAACQTGDAAGLAESGLAEIEHHLVAFLAPEKVGSLRQAVAAKAGVVLDAALMDLALAIRALEMPAEELERRAGEFTVALEAIERQRLVARDLLAGDRRRAVERLETQAAELRREARRALLAVLDATLREAPSRAEIAVKGAIATAIPEFFEPKLVEMSRDFAALVDDILKGHVERAAALIATVRATASELFEIPPVLFDEAESSAIHREPYWVTERSSDGLEQLGGGFVDRLLPSASRASRLAKHLAGEIGELVDRNVENLRWATLQNLNAAFQRFAAGFDERLAETIEATRGAIEAAADKRRAHADGARAELLRLRQEAAALRELRYSLGQLGR
jgi:Dynamin family